MEYFDRIISLGQDCAVAANLRKFKFKDSTYPFDWNITNIKFIADCFRTKFAIFNEIFDCLERSGNGRPKYKDRIYFYHDSMNLECSITKNKYIRRSLRLHNLLCEDKKILFIRKAPKDTIAQIQHVIKLIRRNYPKLKFKILLINNLKEKNINPDFIIHRYKDIKSFNKCENDHYIHNDELMGYKCVSDELKKIKSIKFKQPDKKIDDIRSES